MRKILIFFFLFISFSSTADTGPSVSLSNSGLLVEPFICPHSVECQRFAPDIIVNKSGTSFYVCRDIPSKVLSGSMKIYTNSGSVCNSGSTTIALGFTRNSLPTCNTDIECLERITAVCESTGQVVESFTFNGSPNDFDYSCGTPDPIELCSDGLPPDLNGYYACDRPDLKECPDGRYIGIDSYCPSTPPPLCTDHDTCYTYASNEANCPSTSVFNFDYKSPTDFSTECVTILPGSPDNPGNGGNGDGNENNDPTSDPVTKVSDLDAESLADAIDESLRDDFGNIERAIREGDSKIASSIDDNTNSGNSNARKLEGAVDDLKSSNNTGMSGISSSIDGTNSLLGDISTDLGEILDELQEDEEEGCGLDLDCLVPTFSENNYSSVTDVNGAYMDSVMASPIMASFQNVENLIVFDDPTCPALAFYLGWPIDRDFSSSFHCQLMVEYINPILFIIFKILWIYAGFRILASA
jgi:hypothetical protein